MPLHYSERKVALNDLLAGHVDFALGFTETDGESYPGIDEVSWLEDEYVAICSPAFSAKYGELTLGNYLRARHLVVTPWNEQRGVIDYQLDKLGLQRDISIRTPSLLGAPFIVADSELVMSMPRYAAQKLRQAVALDIHPLPFPVPPYQIKIYLHRKNGRPEACRWLRQQLQALAAL